MAVVGFQFQHTALQALFQNITFNCEGHSNCYKHCGDNSWECYLVDNNGYIIAAEKETDAGKFFGEVRGPIMMSLVTEGVFEKIRIYDYQAVCFKNTDTNNAANILLTVRKVKLHNDNEIRNRENATLNKSNQNHRVSKLKFSCYT